ncbi:hypothetical protein ACH5RR_036800 [Cinchona calisaya]|uniref:Uncharacterized protein n=1 Tax=Cinchona calisaya TaxID=153742 RepID=A0ABD2Y5P2_9GENT
MVEELEQLWKNLSINGEEKTIADPLEIQEEFEEDSQLTKAKLHLCEFWARILNLLLGSVDLPIAKLSGDSLGEFSAVGAVEDEIAWGKYMSFCVKLVVSKPLKRATKLSFGTKELTVFFK